MTALTLGTSAIRAQDGLYSLNDLHAAAGGLARHQPSNFLAIDQTKALVAELSVPGNPGSTLKANRTGRDRGTWVCRELVVAYAAWISPSFHLKVIRAFLEAQAPAAPLPPPAAPRRWLLTIDGLSSRMQPVADGAQVGTWEQLARGMAEAITQGEVPPIVVSTLVYAVNLSRYLRPASSHPGTGARIAKLLDEQGKNLGLADWEAIVQMAIVNQLALSDKARDPAVLEQMRQALAPASLVNPLP